MGTHGSGIVVLEAAPLAVGSRKVLWYKKPEMLGVAALRHSFFEALCGLLWNGALD